MQVEPSNGDQREAAGKYNQRQIEVSNIAGPRYVNFEFKATVAQILQLDCPMGSSTLTRMTIFGDFPESCMTLKAKNVEGDFRSCFPLFEHFKWLETCKPPVRDIKFGNFGPNRAQAKGKHTNSGDLTFLRMYPSAIPSASRDCFHEVMPLVRDRASSICTLSIVCVSSVGAQLRCWLDNVTVAVKGWGEGGSIRTERRVNSTDGGAVAWTFR